MRINITPHPTREGWYYLEYRPDGYKGKRERIPVQGYDKACARRDMLEEQLANPDRRIETHPRLKDVSAEYLLWVEKYRAPMTQRNKRQRLNEHIIPALGHYRVKELSQRILDDYGRDMAKGSYRDDIYHLLALITWMVKRNYARPLDWKPEIPEYRPPVKTIPAPEDILQFLKRIPKEDQRILFSLMLYTGLRWNEATKLTWQDYQGDSFRLATTKTKVQERIFIPEHLQQWFRDNQKESGWIFTHNGKKPYSNIQRALDRAEKETGIKMTPHLFRHASATILYQISNDLYAVKNHLRQSRITTTEIYTRYSVERSRQAVQSLAVHLDNLTIPANPDEQRK